MKYVSSNNTDVTERRLLQPLSHRLGKRFVGRHVWFYFPPSYDDASRDVNPNSDHRLHGWIALCCLFTTQTDGSEAAFVVVLPHNMAMELVAAPRVDVRCVHQDKKAGDAAQQVIWRSLTNLVNKCAA